LRRKHESRLGRGRPSGAAPLLPGRSFPWFWSWICLGLAASVPALIVNGLAGDMVLFWVSSPGPLLALPAGALGEILVCSAVFLGLGLLVETVRRTFGVSASLHPGLQLAAVLILETFIVRNCAASAIRPGVARYFGGPEVADGFTIRILLQISVLTGLLLAWRLRRVPPRGLAAAAGKIAFFLGFLVGGFAVVYQRWIRADSYPLPGIFWPLLIWALVCVGLYWAVRKNMFSPARVSRRLLVAAAAFVGAQTAYYAWPPAGDLPNIVVNIWDAARADRLSVYGGDSRTTPNLAELSGRAVVFDNAFSVSNYTYPSHVTFLTGKQYRQHGYNIGDGKEWKKYKKEKTLPEYLRESGYYSVLVTENAWVLAADKGFDKVHWFARPTTYFGPDPHQCEFSTTTEYWNYRLPYLGRWLINRLGSFQDHYYPETLDEIQNRYFQKILIQSRRRGPLFLFINWMNVHDRLHPFSSREPEEEVFDYDFPAEYDLSLRQIDRRLIELHSLLESSPRGYYLVVTSDHGELLGEYGLYGHNMTLFKEVLHVPFVVIGQNLVNARWSPTVSMSGLFRLVRLLAAGRTEAGAIIAAMAEQGAVVSEHGYLPEEHSSEFRWCYTVRTPEFRYISYPYEDGRHGTWPPGPLEILFRVGGDLSPDGNLIGDLPGTAADLREYYRRRCQDLPQDAGPAQGGLSPDARARQEKQLRSLGYLN